MREAGSTAVQEVAFTLTANGLAYLPPARDRGLDVTQIARRISFFNPCNHLFEEVAKFRAARACGPTSEQALYRHHRRRGAQAAQSHPDGGLMLTAQQPYNNVVRTALQALAAVLGGTQSLHTNSYDEALGLPSEEAALLALRTQQVLAHESGVPDVADPLAGSYFVESLTAEIDRRSRELIAQIDSMGGMLAAIEHGWVQDQIHRSAYEWQRQVESGERVVVGVNRFVEDASPPPPPTFRPDPKVERERARALAEWRRGRNAQAMTKARGRLERAARGEDNLMPPILEAIVARATLGEICDTLRQVFGSYRPSGARRASLLVRGPSHIALAVRGADPVAERLLAAFGGRRGERSCSIRASCAWCRASGAGHDELLEHARPSTARRRFSIIARDRNPSPEQRGSGSVSALAQARSAGVTPIDETPRAGAHGSEVAFLHPKSLFGTLIELCRTK